MKRVALYIRVSTDEQVQHGNGLEMQKDALVKYAYLLMSENLELKKKIDQHSRSSLKQDNVMSLISFSYGK